MASHRFEEDIQISVSPKRMWWACITDGHNCAMKSVADKFAKVVNAGDSFGEVGTERTVHLHKGVHSFDVVKCKVEEVDKEKLYIKIHLVHLSGDGTITSSYYLTLHFLEGVTKCIIENKGSEEIQFVEDVKEFIYSSIKKIEAFLLANQNEYTC